MRTHLGVIFGYQALSLAFTYPLALNFAVAIPGDSFDSWQNYWNLWWVRRALLELHTTPFFTHDLYYPTGTSLYFHTLNIFNGLWSLPIQLLSNPSVTYNGVVLFTFVMSGYGTFLLARYVVRVVPTSIAFMAGFIFAFSPFRFAHLLGHMQVLSTEWIPFFVLTYLQMQERPGPLWRRAIVPALFLSLNALCDWYYLLYLLIFCALIVAWQLMRRRTIGDGKRLMINLLSVLTFFAVMVSPMLIPMLAEASTADYLRPPFEETVLLSADLLAFVTPSEFHPLWGEAARQVADQFTSSTSERTVFAGFVPIVLAVIGAWKFRRIARIWLLTLLTFFVLALGPYVHVFGQVVAPIALPYAWLYGLVPLLRLTRSVSRFDVMVMLALAMLAAFGLQVLRSRRNAVVLCSGLIMLEFLAVPYPLTPATVPSFYEQVKHEAGSFAILELPINWDRPHPLLYQTVHGRPLITAYTSRSNPLSVVERTPILNMLRTLEADIIQYDTRAIASSVLSDLDVRYVINHPLTMGAGTERTITNRVLRQMFGNQMPVVDEENLTVYRVPAPEPDRPYLVLGDGWGELRMVDGKPQRALNGRVTLTVMSRAAHSSSLQILARASERPARLMVALPAPALVAQEFALGAELMTTEVSVGLLRGEPQTIFISSTSPVIVSALAVTSDR